MGSQVTPSHPILIGLYRHNSRVRSKTAYGQWGLDSGEDSLNLIKVNWFNAQSNLQNATWNSVSRKRKIHMCISGHFLQ